MIIDQNKIFELLNKKAETDGVLIKHLLWRARDLKGISASEVVALLDNDDPLMDEEIFKTANFVKNEIYGKRLVLFAPLYISNLCNNECLYCAFRNENGSLTRRCLTQSEIANETTSLINQGHKRVLLVAGEAYPEEGLDYVLKSINTIYQQKSSTGDIRRINVNIAPLSLEDFKRLHDCRIGTYQLFQETYHEETYQKLHLKGPKADYSYRLDAVSRAIQAGISDVGIGVLFGLYNWKFEVLALLSHIEYLEKEYGIGPHTISVPRIEPAFGSQMSYSPPFPLDDHNFKKVIAILRIAVPYTGLILSTREGSLMRRQAFDLGISQISAGSKANPGGYTNDNQCDNLADQFSLGDTRSLAEVIEDMVRLEHIPSFCTGCYRLGRIGRDFMDLAKPGLIKSHCLPNAIFTFAEYLHDFAQNDLQEKGFSLIRKMIDKDIISPDLQKKVLGLLHEISLGKRDVYL